MIIARFCEKEKYLVMQVLFISWTSYFTAIAIVLVIYCVLIGLRYYWQEIMATIGIRIHLSQPLSFVAHPLQQMPTAINHENYQPKDADALDGLPLQVQSFTDEIKTCLQQTGNNETDNPD